LPVGTTSYRSWPMFHVFVLSGLLNAAVRYGGNSGADAAF
jgi:hypothetical protein